MNIHFKNPFLIPALIVGLGLTMTSRLAAQVFTTLHSFTELNGNIVIGQALTNTDGADPLGTLVLSGDTLYGTTVNGGLWGGGAVFSVNTNGGASFTNLHSFTGKSDGASPEAGVILSGNILYGTTENGGTGYNGTVFAIGIDGMGLTNVYNFTGVGDGGSPQGEVILSSNILYGTASSGGTGIGDGVVFAVDTDGAGFTNLYSFSDVAPGSLSNGDGSGPTAGLDLSGNTLYGTASGGGAQGEGTVFALNADGLGFTNLHSFTGSDGASPNSRLILSGNILYGTAADGGPSGEGTVFAIDIDGTGFTNLHNLTATDGSSETNSDGAAPACTLVLSGNILYGTATGGGLFGNGTIFAVNTDGTGFTTLYSFSATHGYSNTNSDGSGPSAGLVLSGNTLYGTTYAGGPFANGTVFSLTLGPVSPPPPRLTIVFSGTNVIVTWPTSASGFTLQSATNLNSPTAWSTVSGQFTVTNPISDAATFFRLSQ